MPQYLSPGVYVEELEAGTRPVEGVGTAVAAFVGLAAEGPLHAPTLVTNWTQFTTAFGGFVPGYYLAHAVYAYFNNGGGAAYVVRVGRGAAATEQPARALLSTAGEQPLPAYAVEALDAGAGGNEVTVEVHHPDGGEPADVFRLEVRCGEQHEVFDALTTRPRQRTNAVTAVNQRSTLVRLTEPEERRTTALERPASGRFTLTGGVARTAMEVSPDEYVGDARARTGFAGLESVDTVTMVLLPDLMSELQRGNLDLEQVKAVQLALIAHCELMGDRMAILDTPPGLDAQAVREWRVDTAGYDSKFATLYWPWVKAFDPCSGTNVFVPPAGHVAGIWARSDAERGVHKAPANEVVRGAVDLQTTITRFEHDLLNPVGINCIRAFPGRGIRVWGARTLSSDPAWRYINVRRLFNYVEGSILAGTSWVVYEPNDQDLWGRVKRTIRTFLHPLWLDGALFGATSEQAFYVKCDDETNPSEVIESGRVVCEIGIAPVKPAEFVVFRLAQLPSGTSAVDE
jgi:hypothetical protein